MPAAIALSSYTRTIAGILVLSIITIEFGGNFVLRVVRGAEQRTEFQKTFARAGHGHAGVLVTLALVAQLLADGTHLHGVANGLARNAIWVGAILIPAGFFASSAGERATRPNRMIVLIYVGFVVLAAGLLALGIGLLSAA